MTDLITGTNKSDTIDASGTLEDTIILSGNGNDLVLGGDGDDTLLAGNGNDQVFGNAGDDWIAGGNGADKIHGGSGNDAIFGDNIILGGTGADTIYGDGLDAEIVGGKLQTSAAVVGDDYIAGGNGSESIYGDNGTSGSVGGEDTVDGGGGHDAIFGEGGDDRLGGGSGNDAIGGGEGFDVAVFGGNKADYEVLKTATGYTVRDLKSWLHGDDGTDTVSGVEQLKFRDGTLTLNAPPAAPQDADGASNFVIENAAVGTAVGITAFASDPGDTVIYELVDDAGGLFAIDAASGVVTVNGAIDYETASQHTIVVRATDSNGALSEASFTIDVGNVEQFAIDGYIANALVFADANENGKLDDGEASTTTDAFGNFELASGAAPLVMTGGIDIATGLAFKGSLTAAAGSTYITPLTTLLNELGGDSVALATALGLPPGTDFGALDPIVAASGGDPTAFAAASQILNSVIMTASLIAGSSLDQVSQEQAMAAAFAALASQFAGATGEVALDPLDLINDTATASGVTVDSTLASDTAAVIAASNAAIDAIVAAPGTPEELLTGVTAASIVAQGETAVAIAAIAEGTEPNNLVDEYTGAALGNLVAAAESQVGNTDGSEGGKGTAADDTPTLTEGSDTYDGLEGDDVIAGLGGLDILHGGIGNDSLSGDAANDLLYGGVGEDSLTGGAGDDQLDGGSGNDTYYHSGIAAIDGHDVIVNIDGLDKIVFTTKDTFYDMRPQRVGNDLVVGPILDLPPDYPYDGTITVKDFFSSAVIGLFVQIDGAYNLDYGTDPELSTFFINRDIANGANNTDYSEHLLGTDGDDVINANDGYFDRVAAGSGNDLVFGGAGFDVLRGQGGDDTLDGGSGSDRLYGGLGNDILDGGGDDTDRANYDEAAAAIDIDLQNIVGGYSVTASDGYGGVDQLVNIENIRASEFSDVVKGDAVNNRLEGRGGDDILEGRSGNDDLRGGAGNDTLTGGSGDDQLDGGAGNDTYYHSGIAAVDGHDVIDNINGLDKVVFTAKDTFYDMAPTRVGDDLIVGPTLDLPPDYPYDGTITITNFYASSVLGIFVEIDGAYNADYGTDPELSTFFMTRDISNGVDNLDYSEHLLGTDEDDTINANDGFFDRVAAGGGNDLVFGGAGFDLLRGQEGDDTLDGGTGSDRLRGGAGNDILDGGEGDDDRANYDETAAAIDIDLENIVGGYAVTASDGDGGVDQLANVENIRASAFNDVVKGDAVNNRLEGRGGDDTLDGRGGEDTLIGAAGNDSISGGEAHDDLDGGNGNDILDGGLDSDDLAGGDGDDSLSGGDGDDFMSGAAGSDTLDGGDGFDNLSFAFDAVNGLSVNLLDGKVYDDGYGFVDAIANIEWIDGTDFSDLVVGDAADNWFRGGGGDDTLLGGDGNDGLEGAEGADNIDGGAGYNNISFQDYELTSGINVNLALGIVFDDGFGFTDTIANIQEVVGGTLDDTVVGNGDDNFLWGREGNDSLSGGHGGDLLIAADGDDTLLGGDGDDQILLSAGNDTIDGGTGTFDTLAVGWEDTSTQGIVIDLGTGTVANDGYGGSGDTVLGGIENVSGGAFDDSVVGDNATNWLWGNGGQDTLDGGQGNDALIGDDGDDALIGGIGNDGLAGGAQLDTLTGGSGADSFNFQHVGAANADLVTDYVHADGDLIYLSDLIDIGGDIADYVKVEDTAGGALLSVDLDGAANGQSFQQIATLNGVLSSGQITFHVDGVNYSYDGGAFV